MDSISSLGMYSRDFIRLGTRLENFPLEFQAGRFENANRGLSHFRSNAIAGNKCDFVNHSPCLCAPGAIACGILIFT